MKTTRDMGKIIQKARLQNSADLASVMAGKIKPGRVREADVELLVDTGAAMLCLTRLASLLPLADALDIGG